MSINPSSPIQCVTCSGGGGAGRLLKGRKDQLGLEQDVSLAGSEWVRSIVDELGLQHTFSDFFHVDLEDDLGLDDDALGPVDRAGIAFNELGLSQDDTVSGGRTDGGGGGAEPVDAIFDSNASKGQVVYVSGDGHVDLAQSNGEPQTLAIGLAMTDVVSGETGQVITSGLFTNESWSLTPGAVYYLDYSVAGGMTSTYPTTVGGFVVILGAAISPTQINIEIHWANYIGA